MIWSRFLDLDLDNSLQEPEAISATSGYALRKSGEPTLEGRKILCRTEQLMKKENSILGLSCVGRISGIQ